MPGNNDISCAYTSLLLCLCYAFSVGADDCFCVVCSALDPAVTCVMALETPCFPMKFVPSPYRSLLCSDLRQFMLAFFLSCPACGSLMCSLLWVWPIIGRLKNTLRKPNFLKRSVFHLRKWGGAWGWDNYASRCLRTTVSHYAKQRKYRPINLPSWGGGLGGWIIMLVDV